MLSRRSTRSGLGGLLVTGLAAVTLPLLGPAAGAAAPPPPPRTASTASVDPALSGGPQRSRRVVVRLRPDAGDGPRRAVAELGGEVTRELPVVDGFAATLPGGTVDDLATVPGVAVVSTDRALEVQSGTWSPSTATLVPRVLEAPRPGPTASRAGA